MRIYVVSYATGRFRKVRQELNLSAIEQGVPNVLSFDEADLKRSSFYERNRDLLNETCGAGYWAWKPYFIAQALELLEEGDVLFYCDAGSLFRASPQPLVDICATNSSGLLLFDARPLTNRQFTKRDCFIRLDCDEPRHWDNAKVIATILGIRKSAFTVAFVEEWLRHCQDRAVISDDPNCCGAPNLEGFLVHRHDQAILSVLASKHNVETYRNPTHWGNFLKLPEFRVPGEKVVSPFELPPAVQTYSAIPQANSPYGTIFEINRLPNFTGKIPIPAPGPPQEEERPLRRKLLRFLESAARRPLARSLSSPAS